MNITPEKLQELITLASQATDKAIKASRGTLNVNKVYLETLADEINKFFSRKEF